MSIARSTASRSTATSCGSPAATSKSATTTSASRRASASTTREMPPRGRCDFFCAAIRMSPDSFTTLAERAEFRHKIERSDFLGVAFPATTEEEFFAELQRIQKKYFDATHHCWAFRLRERARSSDAGEPSGTAGKRSEERRVGEGG